MKTTPVVLTRLAISVLLGGFRQASPGKTTASIRVFHYVINGNQVVMERVGDTGWPVLSKVAPPVTSW